MQSGTDTKIILTVIDSAVPLRMETYCRFLFPWLSSRLLFTSLSLNLRFTIDNCVANTVI